MRPPGCVVGADDGGVVGAGDGGKMHWQRSYGFDPEGVGKS